MNAITSQVPQALWAHLSEQQSRARELRALLEMLEETDSGDRDAILAVASRMAGEIYEELDSVTLEALVPAAEGEPHGE